MVTLLAALVLSAAAPASGQTAYYLPNLPVRVQLDAQPGVDFCSSGELLERLRMEFAQVDRPEALAYPDLTLRCERHDETRVRFALRDHEGKTLDEFKMKKVGGRESYESLAYLVARRLATGKKSIRASLAAYLANSRYMNASGGIAAFDRSDWSGATDQLYRGLESDAPTAALYFGLYAAHAKLGHSAQARWYLLEYCESEGKRPDRLDARRLSYLRSMEPPAGGAAPEPADLSRWRALIADRKWSVAMSELKDLIEKAPWTVEAYDALADAYEGIGWDLFAQNWRRRAKLARRTAADARLHEELIDALQTP